MVTEMNQYLYVLIIYFCWQKLANLSSFLSPSDAIYHDLQVLLDTDQVDVKLTIETMLSRVDGSDSKAMWKVLPHAVVRVGGRWFIALDIKQISLICNVAYKIENKFW